MHLMFLKNVQKYRFYFTVNLFFSFFIIEYSFNILPFCPIGPAGP